MDRRYGTRKKADIKALIYKSGLPVAFGRILNVGRGGMYLECAVDRFRHPQPLEIELFSSDSSARGSSFHKCFIARIEQSGLALAFCDIGAARASG